MQPSRVAAQAAFLLEADRLKSVLRRTKLADGSRQENSAEHSWHLALCAMVLAEYVAEPVNLLRALQMLVVHDLVEIEAGDTFAYDAQANASKEERERAAADRLFVLLPPDQACELRSSWDEFESNATPEARFAHACDRFQPFLLNRAAGGGTWRAEGVSREKVLARMEPVRTALPALWPMVRRAIDEFFSGGT